MPAKDISKEVAALNVNARNIKVVWYFLYVNALNNEKSSLIDFKILVQDKIQLQKIHSSHLGPTETFLC